MGVHFRPERRTLFLCKPPKKPVFIFVPDQHTDRGRTSHCRHELHIAPKQRFFFFISERLTPVQTCFLSGNTEQGKILLLHLFQRIRCSVRRRIRSLCRLQIRFRNPSVFFRQLQTVQSIGQKLCQMIIFQIHMYFLFVPFDQMFLYYLFPYTISAALPVFFNQMFFIYIISDNHSCVGNKM